jgi:hypothetical protein
MNLGYLGYTTRHKTYQPTNSMKKIPCYKVNSSTVKQEIPRILWGPEGSLPCSQEPVTCPHSEPGQSNRSHPNQFLIRLHLTFSYHLCLCLPNGFLPSGFPCEILYAPFFSSSIWATCPAHPILLDLITWIILCEQYKSWSSSLCSFLQ